MRRLFLLFFALSIIFALCACDQTSLDASTAETMSTAESSEPPSKDLMVGYARVDITPKITVPLRGFGDSSEAAGRMARTVLEPLYVTCTAVTGDNGVTALLFSVDIIFSDFADKLISSISESTGISEENIFISASHTHAGPSLTTSGKAFYMNYMKELRAALPEAAIRAMHDRAPAEMTYGTIETESLAFSRHYVYTSASGKESYSFGGVDSIASSGLAEHLTDPYTDMHVVRFAREKGKDVVMANWQAHPLLHGGEGRQEVSSDFIGPFRTAVELAQNCNFIYLQGAAGNLNSITAIPSEVRTEDANVYGAILANYVSDCLSHNMQAADGYAVKTMSEILTASGDLNLGAIAIGNSVSFVTAPNELFDTTAVYVEENSPYSISMIMGYTNGSKGYIPTKNLYEYLPDYQWYEIGSTKYEAGTAERLQEKFVEMLKKLWEQPIQQQTTEPEVAPIPEKEVVGDLTLAWNIYRADYAPGGRADQSSRTPEEDGYYHVVFAVDGKPTTLRVKNKNLIEIIDFNDITGLVLDGDVVTDVKVLREFAGELAANRSFVESVDGNTVHCDTAATEGMLFDLTLTDMTVIYDVSTKDENCGSKSALRKGDQIIALRDLFGNISCVYIINRANVDDLTHTDHCICGGAAEGIHGDCVPSSNWIPWGDDPEEWGVLPTESGNYYLTRDVYVSKRYKVTAGENITICLNGKQVYCVQARMVAVLGTLNICDCQFSCTDGMYSYEGTILSEHSVESSSGGAFYMYTGGELNLYSGNITGTGIWSMGGLIYAASHSTTNIYNATLTGASALHEAGGIYVAGGTVNIYGGVITGGYASTKGSGIYYKSGTLTISGSPKITGNTRSDLGVAEGKTITIGEGGLKPGAEIGIALDSGTGVFATNAKKEDAKYFVATNGGKISWNSETNELSVEVTAG